ncbi:MAG: sugar phosphate isomerase/epimerase family protein [Chitinophagaceae bacterium]|jgi:sugar phosphate isomerase/epimerase
MTTQKKNSRRIFLTQSALLGAGVFFSKDILALANTDSKFGGVQIGTITYSFRSLPTDVDKIIAYCKQAGVSALELMGDTAEAYAGSPVANIQPMRMMGPPPGAAPGQRPQMTDEQRKAMAERVQKGREWRETVSMDKFVELRKKFKDAGITIYAYKPNALGENNSDGEIEYAMKAAKALGATSVTVELPTKPEQSKRLGDIAAKHKVYVGYHAHLQATDTAWDVALAQSPYNSLNLDCGHYIAAGGNNTKESLLKLIEAKHDRITSMHLKDRTTKEKGQKNLVWGTGDTPIVEVLQLMKKNKYKFPATIELEYEVPADSDAVKEVAKCVEYAKKALS